MFLGVLTALLFSAFIYFEEYGLHVKFIDTLFGLLALALLLYIPKKSVLIAGFFIGLFWFYWIGYSFEYTGVGYLKPIITLLFAFIYMLFFGVIALSNRVYVRAILLFLLSFFEPFDFNWMQLELLFVNSYIGIEKYHLAIILFSLSLPAYIQSRYKLVPLLLILFTINVQHPSQAKAPLHIKLVSTDIKQENKWKEDYFLPTVELGFEEIEKAIANRYDIIVFPESFFPIYMNHYPKLITILKNYSQDITIITGSLLSENHIHYNVTYMFQKGEYTIAKKTILVPFGEYIPLPSFARDFINNTFFAGEADFQTAKKPTDFLIQGVKFRNAICYEATCKELYEGDVKYLIATSNNAWFAPSIEATLQKLLLKFYARKNGTTIYHSANYKGTGVIQ